MKEESKGKILMFMAVCCFCRSVRGPEPLLVFVVVFLVFVPLLLLFFVAGFCFARRETFVAAQGLLIYVQRL